MINEEEILANRFSYLVSGYSPNVPMEHKQATHFFYLPNVPPGCGPQSIIPSRLRSIGTPGG